ncbi:MAG: four helix bundle protein [Candidatus Omnitrophica bacterium]|nr:four helix bundle protein [Candidatus Omnitrophota bacterium]
MDSKTRAFNLSLKVINFIDKIPKDISTAVLSKQLIRAATSIGANIIEAQASSSRKDFTNFFCYSLKSANETKYWLELLRDSGKINKELIGALIKETEEMAKILASSILTLKGRKKF